MKQFCKGDGDEIVWCEMASGKRMPLDAVPINRLIKIILSVIGILASAYQGISYTTREKVVDLGPIQMTTEKARTIPRLSNYIIAVYLIVFGILGLVR